MFPPIALRHFLLINTHTTHNSSIRSDEGLTLETWTVKLYGGQFTLSTRLIILNRVLLGLTFSTTTDVGWSLLLEHQPRSTWSNLFDWLQESSFLGFSVLTSSAKRAWCPEVRFLLLSLLYKQLWIQLGLFSIEKVDQPTDLTNLRRFSALKHGECHGTGNGLSQVTTCYRSHPPLKLIYHRTLRHALVEFLFVSFGSKVVSLGSSYE